MLTNLQQPRRGREPLAALLGRERRRVGAAAIGNVERDGGELRGDDHLAAGEVDIT